MKDYIISIRLKHFRSHVTLLRQVHFKILLIFSAYPPTVAPPFKNEGCFSVFEQHEYP